MSGDVLSTMAGYVLCLEQHLLAITFTLLGASAGILTGSIKATKQLQPNFTSTGGFRELIYGSAHKDEKDRLSVSDLLKSWVPGFQHKSASVKQSTPHNRRCTFQHCFGADPFVEIVSWSSLFV
jgi:hypothetical protein